MADQIAQVVLYTACKKVSDRADLNLILAT